MKLLIKYHHPDLQRLSRLEIGNWIDLRAAEDVTLHTGDFKMISLGISVRLPKGYEAHIAPRSSSFSKWGFLQVNSVGVIDESYCGEQDIWKLPVYATRDAEIRFNDRICQFRIMPVMPDVELLEVESLDAPNRGGFGSTGTN